MRNIKAEALALYLRGADYTSADIATHSGMTSQQARGAVRRLAAANTIARIGTEYPPRYRLLQGEKKTTTERAIASRPPLQAAWGRAHEQQEAA